MAGRPDFRFRLSQTAWLIPFCLRVKIRRCAAASCVRAAKSPARFPVRAADVISVDTLFWKILVTRVKRFFRKLVRWAKPREIHHNLRGGRPSTRGKGAAMMVLGQPIATAGHMS